MKKIYFSVVLLIFSFYSIAQNPLTIPDTLSGTVFNLTVQKGTKTFFTGFSTPTFGYNGDILGPTLFINAGDSITLNVTNNLTTPTTVHWHGFHVSPQNDGGPHQIINPGVTWSPSFVMRNEASTFWYHPHGEAKTEIQVSKGLAGMIIVRDTIESKYGLPRTYGVDDIPLIVQTKAFDVLYQFQTATHEDSVVMVNAVINPYVNVPAQIVRFRILNGSADRTFLFGLTDTSTFYLIGTDGGLLSAPHPMTRLRLSTGERAEILVDFSKYTPGQQLNLFSYSSELPQGIIGADSVGVDSIQIGEGYYNNPLNGLDFNIIQFNVAAPTPNPVTAVPTAFAPKIPISASSAVRSRDIVLHPDTAFSGMSGFVDGPFFINGDFFHMDSINIITYINDIEIWSLINQTYVAHPFHIHDIEFFVLDINGNPPPPQYAGLKDVILVQPGDTVRFITQFKTFWDNYVPYMYHCHLLHHEDEGMMGTFLVMDSTQVSSVNEFLLSDNITVFPNPTSGNITVDSEYHLSNPLFVIYNSIGKVVKAGVVNSKSVKSFNLNITDLESGIYFVTVITKNKKEIVKIIKQ